jgi:hypothetical protein
VPRGTRASSCWRWRPRPREHRWPPGRPPGLAPHPAADGASAPLRRCATSGAFRRLCRDGVPWSCRRPPAPWSVVREALPGGRCGNALPASLVLTIQQVATPANSQTTRSSGRQLRSRWSCPPKAVGSELVASQRRSDSTGVVRRPNMRRHTLSHEVTALRAHWRGPAPVCVPASPPVAAPVTTSQAEACAEPGVQPRSGRVGPGVEDLDLRLVHAHRATGWVPCPPRRPGVLDVVADGAASAVAGNAAEIGPFPQRLRV